MTSPAVRTEAMGIGRVAGVPALEVRGLSVAYDAPRGGYNQVVRDVDLVLEHGQIVGLAGESGCGKSTVALAATGYLGGGVRILAGRSILAGVDLLDTDMRSLRHVWGKHIAYVSQQASAALNPALTVAHQLAQPLVRHVGLSGAALRERQIDLLTKVSVFDPEGALARYPFQFSGGQQQRIAIAIALSCQPEVLILDEPTTGLDVTTQARLSALLRSIVEETQVAALYVSHDLALLNEVVDRAVIMYGGEIVEAGSVAPVLRRPRHPYTQALLRAVPSTDRPGVIQGILGRPPSTVAVDACPFAPRCEFVVDECRSHAIPLRTVGEQEVRCIRADEAARSAYTGALLPRPDIGAVLLDVDDVSCTYQNAPKPVVRGVTFSVRRGETVGIVGESGSGKSTLLRALSGLHPTTSGTITYDGRPLEPRAVKRARTTRHEIQLIFQNPDSSLNPQHTIGDIIKRPLKLFRPDVPRAGRREAAVELLEAVKLPRSILHRRPPELSGGQKQRVAIARAFAARPALLLCDEVTSALDVSVQATVLELIAQLSVATGTAVIFVSHDLAVVRAIATSTLVMRDGEVCETGETSELFEHPRHPYTRELLAAIPKLPSAA